MQVKPKPLYCTGSTNCWCSNLETILERKAGYDKCLSPGEILEVHAVSEKDVNYLNSLKHREFIY